MYHLIYFNAYSCVQAKGGMKMVEIEKVLYMEMKRLDG